MPQRCDKNRAEEERKCKAGKSKKGLFDGVLELPPLLRRIGPKQIQAFKPFVRSIGVYGLTGVICLIYMTDWKAVLQFLPYYSGKFYVEEPPPPPPPKPVQRKEEVDQEPEE